MGNNYEYLWYFPGDYLERKVDAPEEYPKQLVIESYWKVEKNKYPVFQVRDENGQAWAVQKIRLDKFYNVAFGQRLSKNEEMPRVDLLPKRVCGNCVQLRLGKCNNKTTEDPACDEYLYIPNEIEL